MAACHDGDVNDVTALTYIRCVEEPREQSKYVDNSVVFVPAEIKKRMSQRAETAVQFNVGTALYICSARAVRRVLSLIAIYWSRRVASRLWISRAAATAGTTNLSTRRR